MNSPAICIADEDFDFKSVLFTFLTSKKKHIGKFGKNIFGYEHKEYTTPIERFTTFLVGLGYYSQTQTRTAKVLLKVTRLAQKVKQYFKLLRTVVFLNIDYNK